MTDTPQQAAARKLKDSTENFQLAAVRLSHASEEELVHQAQLYLRRYKQHAEAVEAAREAFKEPLA